MLARAQVVVRLVVVDCTLPHLAVAHHRQSSRSSIIIIISIIRSAIQRAKRACTCVESSSVRRCLFASPARCVDCVDAPPSQIASHPNRTNSHRTSRAGSAASECERERERAPRFLPLVSSRLVSSLRVEWMRECVCLRSRRQQQRVRVAGFLARRRSLFHPVLVPIPVLALAFAALSPSAHASALCAADADFRLLTSASASALFTITAALAYRPSQNIPTTLRLSGRTSPH